MYTAPDGELSPRPNMFSLSGTGFFGTVGRSVDLGEHKLLIYVYLSYVSPIHAN